MLSSTFTEEDFYERDHLALCSEKFTDTPADPLEAMKENLVVSDTIQKHDAPRLG